jgi:hypothetical protein
LFALLYVCVCLFAFVGSGGSLSGQTNAPEKTEEGPKEVAQKSCC